MNSEEQSISISLDAEGVPHCAGMRVVTPEALQEEDLDAIFASCQVPWRTEETAENIVARLAARGIMLVRINEFQTSDLCEFDNIIVEAIEEYQESPKS